MAVALPWFTLLVVGPLFAQPTITFKDPVPPTNKTRVLAQRCPGDLCLENCVFELTNLTCTVEFQSSLFRELGDVDISLLDSDGTTLATTNTTLSGTNQTIRPQWTGTKEVTCDSSETLQLVAVAQESEDYTTPQGPAIRYYYNTNTLYFTLHCVGCEKATRTEANGATRTEHSTADQSVRLGCVIANLDQEPRTLDVTVNSALGWLVVPVESTLELADGETRELFIEVIIPGGTVDGTEDTITVSSVFQGQPESASAASMSVRIDTPLRLGIGEVDAEGNVAVQVSGPWNAEILLEWSGDLKGAWEVLTVVPPSPGLDAVTIKDPAPHPGDSRFYRASIQPLSPGP